MKIIRLNVYWCLLILLSFSCGSENTKDEVNNSEETISESDGNTDLNTKGVEYLTELEGDYIVLKKIDGKYYNVSDCLASSHKFLIGNNAASPKEWYIGEEYYYEQYDKLDRRQFAITEVTENKGKVSLKCLAEENISEGEPISTFEFEKTENSKVLHLNEEEFEPDGLYLTLQENQKEFKLKPCTDIQEIIAIIPNSFTELTKMNEGEYVGEWVYYEECHYGLSKFTIEENHIYISAGGDEASYIINEMIKIKDKVTINCTIEYWGEPVQFTIDKIYDDYSIIDSDIGWINSLHFVSEDSQGEFKTVKEEPCYD